MKENESINIVRVLLDDGAICSPLKLDAATLEKISKRTGLSIIEILESTESLIEKGYLFKDTGEEYE